jgi:FkbM family methyltransferase
MASAYANQGVFLDIGANTGQYSLFMSRYSKEVHAFEPWEPVRKRFSRMVEINHINNIVIHAVGLSDESAKKPFFRPPENNLGSGSFLDGFRDDNRFEGDVLELQIGDEALKKAGVSSVAMIKMDIEGYEKLALKGLRGTLQKNRPIVMFEMTVNPQVPVSIKSHAEIAGLFPENYEFLAFTQPDDKYTGAYTLKPSEAVVRFDKYKIYNIVAYPIEKRAHFSRQRPG